jgi:hypothetical protein
MELISSTGVVIALEIAQTTIKSVSQCSGMPMLPFVFRCPVFKKEVQHWLDDVDDPPAGGESYEAITCPACTRLHFVNRKTGKLLGDEEK